MEHCIFTPSDDSHGRKEGAVYESEWQSSLGGGEEVLLMPSHRSEQRN